MVLMSDGTDIFERINSGEFNNRVPYTGPNSTSAYHVEAQRIDAAFRAALFEYCGVTDNPKRDKCYSLAYEHGHGSGYNEIAIYFVNFVELIK